MLILRDTETSPSVISSVQGRRFEWDCLIFGSEGTLYPNRLVGILHDDWVFLNHNMIDIPTSVL